MTMNIPATGKALLLAFLIAAPSILTGCKMKSGGKASEGSIFNLPEGQAPGALRIDSIYCRDPFIVADEASKTYYLYRSVPVKESGNGRGAVEAFASKDLENWYGPERVFTVPEDNSLTVDVDPVAESLSRVFVQDALGAKYTFYGPALSTWTTSGTI